MQVETVKEYVARDGARFKQQDTCEKYEAELSQVEPIITRLPKTDLKYGTYAQHDQKILLQVKRDLFVLVLEKYGKRFPQWKTVHADDVGPMSIVYRVLSDCDGPLANAWSRLTFFNFENGREYDQPYFANNPNGTTLYKADKGEA